MKRHHRCDPRSDYQCAQCEQDQLDYERMVENAREAEADADLRHDPCEACDATGHCCHDCERVEAEADA